MLKLSKNDKKLLKKIKKMGVGDEINLNGFNVLCVETHYYLLIHPNKGIFEKNLDEIKEWIVFGEEKL